MSSFQSFLHVGGKTYEILYSDLHLGQALDELGRPASPTFGGIFTVKLSMFGQDDPTLADWMFSPTKIMDGKVVLKRIDSNATLKVIKFYNAYCVGMDMHFDGTANASFFTVTLRISPEQIDIGGLFHDNKWPDESPIHEIADADEPAKKEPSALSEGLHTLLDVVGMIPIVGEIADGANALLYAAEGDYANAALSAAAMIPLAGNVVGAAKLAKRGVKLLGKAKKLVPPRLLKKLDEGVALAKKVCEKDPVDVATGMMLTRYTDVELPGPVPFVWERVWYSASDRRGALGYGWHHRYDMGLTMDADTGTVVLRGSEGRQIAFETSSVAGQPVLDRASGLTLYPPAADDPAGMPWRVWDQALRVWYMFTTPTPSGLYQPLYAVANTLGQRIQFSYGERGQLETIADSAGRLLTLTYNEQGLIEGLYGPHPDQVNERIRLAGYQYDESGNLATYTDAESNQWQHRYDQHLLVQTTLPTGLSFYWVYEGEGTEARCVHTWGDGNIHEGRFAYVDATTTLMTDSDGITQYKHQGGLVSRKTNALGGEWRYEYNAFDELVAETGPLGATTRYGYDEGGNRLWTQYPDETRIQTAYDETDQTVAYTDARGSTWQYTHNEQGLLARQTDPLGAVTAYAYDEQGRLVTVTNALDQDTRFRYDEQHQLIHIVTPDDALRSRSYDALGRTVKLTDSTGAAQERAYDWLGRLIQVVEPDGSVQEQIYDGVGNVREARQGDRMVQYTYTGAGRLAERRQAGERIGFSYDREGRLVGLTNEAGEQYHFELDALGQIVTETGFDGLTRRYERDAAGRVTKLMRPANRTTTYSYDVGGRLCEVQYSDGSWQHYAYDDAGDLSEARTADSVVRLERNATGQVVTEEQNGHSVQRIYNRLGQRVGLTSSQGAAIELVLDWAANVTQVLAGNWQANFGYDQKGLVVQRQLDGTVHTRIEYDDIGRPTQHHIRARLGDQARQRDYQWVGADQLVSLNDTITGLSQYQYDALGTLTGALYGDGNTSVRQTDRVGNLYRRGDQQDRQYGTGGQLYLNEEGTRYSYDAEGNLTGKTLANGRQWHYDWDGAGQLTAVKRPDGYTIRFSYDALGRRIRKRFRGKTIRWVWDGDKPLHEWTEGAVDSVAGKSDDVITWLFEEDTLAPIAKLTNQTSYSVVTDHAGTPIALFDREGEQTWAAQLDCYGSVRQGVGNVADCPFRYQGQYEDIETGLYYNRFRYYDPTEGTYISQDPIRLRGGMEYYSYVTDPNLWIDPLGLVRILTSGKVKISAYPGPNAGGIEHTPIHAHIEDGTTKTRVLMEDYTKKGKKVGSIGDVYPGDPAMTKDMKKVVGGALDDLANKTKSVFETGNLPCGL